MNTMNSTPLPAELPRAVVFDMDGVLLDSERWERSAWQAVAPRFGQTVPDDLYAALVGRRESDTRLTLRQHFGTAFALEEFRAAVKTHLRESLAAGDVPRKAYVTELLDALDARGIAKAIATSSTRESAMRRLGSLMERFPVRVFAEDVSHGKPHPEVFQRAAEGLRLPAEQCLALEDSPAGLQGAEAAGMTVVFIPDILPPPPGTRFVANSLKEVLTWLQSTGRSTANQDGRSKTL